MPRRSRIDTPGALHHIICRGNDRRKIFNDDADRDWFVERLGTILTETRTTCYAWTLIPNHFHLLLRTGNEPVSTAMRRLLTGYAMYYNRRHRRHGHLFQNRYKSILCQDEPYFLELVRYLHLNSLRAKLVPDLTGLDKYPYSGHSAIMGEQKLAWQDTDSVLNRFGKQRATARRKYRTFVAQGISQGRRKDLTGGGLVRSAGGWEGVKAYRRAGIFEKGDERILGSGDFVQAVLKESGQQMNQRYRLKADGWDLDKVASRVAEVLGMDVEAIWQAGRQKPTVTARSLLCYWAVRELGMTQADVAQQVSMTAVGVGKAVVRGQAIAAQNGYRLLP